MNQRALSVLLILIVGSSAAGCASHRVARVGSPEAEWAQGVALEAPLPADARMIYPTKRRIVHRLTRGLRGPWYGRWEDGTASVLLAEDIYDDKVTILYTWSGNPADGNLQGSKRVSADVKSPGAIEFKLPDGCAYSFEIGVMLRTLYGSRTCGENRHEIRMRGGKSPPQRGNSVSLPDPAGLKYTALGGGAPDDPPTIVESHLPRYPDLCVEGGFEGVVPIEIVIDTDGQVCCASVGQGEPKHPFLVEAAIEGIRKWLFTPGTRAGLKVCCFTTVPVRFELD